MNVIHYCRGIKFINSSSITEWKRPVKPRKVQLLSCSNRIATTTKRNHAPTVDDLQSVSKTLPEVLLLVGTRNTRDDVTSMLQYADHTIVGTGLKVEGDIGKLMRIMGVKQAGREANQVRLPT